METKKKCNQLTNTQKQKHEQNKTKKKKKKEKKKKKKKKKNRTNKAAKENGPLGTNRKECLKEYIT